MREAHRRREAAARRDLRRKNYVFRIDLIALAQQLAQLRSPYRRFPFVELFVQGHTTHGQRLRFEQAGAAQMQHHFGNTAGEKHLDGWMISRTVWQRVHDSWNESIDSGPIVGTGAAQTSRMCDCGQM